MPLAPDNAALQVFYGTLPLIGTTILAVWNNNSRLSEISKRIDDLRSEMHSDIADVKTSLGKVEDRVTDLERGLRLVRS